MSEHPVADGPSDSSASGPTEAPALRRNPLPWLLVTVLVALAAVLAYAAVMVVRMLA
ncbi:hypothetical protein [Yinghuangia sp. YIM S09857]|uniref:hypothetical protein n=1 Tax=Yinghuangia sp. YIM S09857 TaxID=3436929 RepID=UPI003F53B26B